MWKKIKEALFNWFFLLLFSCISFLAIIGFASDIPQLFEESEEKVVEETFTSKGLYFGLQYYIQLSDGKVHRIFKKDFLQLEEGDTFKLSFNQFSVKDFLLVTSILMLLIGGGFAIAYLLTFNIFGHMRWFKWIDRKKEQIKGAISSPFKRNEKTLDMSKRVIMITLILSLSFMLLFIAKNAVYKIIPFGKTNAVAEIIDHTEDRTISPKAVVYTYSFIYQYKDEAGKLYKTRKNVSSATYNMYKDRELIPIVYRDNFPYDTFIDNRSIGEFISPLVNMLTFIFALVGYLVYFLIKRYLEVWGMPFIRKRV